MIDFRYHLVSLVGVFLALAIGVVLGAGPLRDSIGDTLTSQVDLLREDRLQLQSQVDDLSAQLAARDDALASVAPVVAGQALAGTSTVVVALPGADPEVVADLADAVEDAAGSVSGVVRVERQWVSPEASAQREEVAAALPERSLSPLAADEVGVPVVLAAALADAVAVQGPVLSGTASVAGPEALEALAEADLVSVEGDPALRAGSALVVAPGVADQPGTGDEAWLASRSAAELALLAALEEASGAVVLAGPATAADPDGALAVLRGDELAAQVSGVDDADSPAGSLAAALALREQLDGGAGQYGSEQGASAALPALPARGEPGGGEG
ncbi:copper transporter [uncultured Pseudokineococcus sp.]|uniref:copper transporter n=1 Tax=uncultured Pseudokineococcus sp. TaxID=1642928 RepID=UPI0026273A7E|nr:copper transporter [uncultured Pseudokineococcus sp.]